MSPSNGATVAQRMAKYFGGLRTVKHLKQVTAATPAPAAAWQDAVCILVTTISGIIEAFGGESPFGVYIVDKCTIPGPNEQ